MATTRSQFAQLLAPGLQKVMFEWLNEHPEEYRDYLSVKETSKPYEDVNIMAGFGLYRRKFEGEPITYDDPIQGGTHRIIMDTYALGWQITEEMLEDEQYSMMNKMPAELMKSCKHTYEVIAANVLNLGNTTAFVTIDGGNFFSTAHPLLGGGSYSNLITQDLSITALQDLILNYENMVNERGLKMLLSPTDVWLPPDLQFRAAKIFQTPLEPFTGNNDVNVMKDRLTPHVLHYLTSTTGWYVSSKEVNNAEFHWRVMPESSVQDDFETGGVRHKVRFRLGVGVREWRGWMASRP